MIPAPTRDVASSLNSVKRTVECEQHPRSSVQDVNSDSKCLRSQEEPWPPLAAIEDTVQQRNACEN